MAAAKKKKRFFTVQIPLLKKETQLQAFEPKDLNGRYIQYDLTRILKGKAMNLSLKVKVNEKEEAITSPREVRLLPFYVKRLVRRGTNYVEDSFLTESKDSEVRIKPFLVTRRKVSREVRKSLRNKTKEELSIWAKENTSEQLFEDVLKNKIQRELSIKLKKIYPLSTCEIRVLKVEKDKK